MKSYDLSIVGFTVGGVAMNGYGESDAVKFEWAADLVAPTVTADGKVVFTRINNRLTTVTVTLMQTSRAVKLLMDMLEQQHGDSAGVHPSTLAGVAFQLLDPSTGDSYAEQNCVFGSRPAPSKGRTVGEVEFKLFLPDPQISFGSANT